VRASGYISASAIPAQEAKSIMDTAATALVQIHSGAEENATGETR
jgi:hypothetical protein